MVKIWYEITSYFLRLGVFGFGGPLANIAMMQKELVEKRKWITESEFQSAFSLIKAMPGAVGVQVAAYMGRRRGGAIGAVLAAFGIVFPAFLMMVFFAWLETTMTKSDFAQGILDGIQISAFALILTSVWGLVKNHKTKTMFWVLATLALGLTFQNPQVEPLVILSFAIIWAFAKKLNFSTKAILPLGLVVDPQFVKTFLYAGAFVFGSGLAIIPLLEHDVVNVHHWVTHDQFLNALALGQATPGPVLVTATYIGFLHSSFWGAILATILVFGPGVFHMSTWFPWAVRKLGRQLWINDFLFGAIAAVVGSISAALIRLGGGYHWSPTKVVVFLALILWVFIRKPSSWLIVPVGSVALLICEYFIRLFT